MARYFKTFNTAEDRKTFEQEQKKKNPSFHVCMHITTRQLEKDLCKPKVFFDPCKVASVYCFDDED